MLSVNFVYVGVVIGLIGTALYTRDTIRGLTHPNRVTWLLWGVVPMLAFAAELHTGVGLQSLLAFSIGFGPLVVFGASFVNRSSVWKIRPLDWTCGALSIVGTAVWLLTSKGVVAIAASIIADLLAGLPTIIKSWKAPETETAAAYLGGLMNAGITLLTVKTFSTAEVAFPAYIVLVAGLELVLVGGRLGPRLRKRRLDRGLENARAGNDAEVGMKIQSEGSDASDAHSAR